MGAIREAVVGFSDDGLPIRSARVLRRALQYQHLAVARSPWMRRTRSYPATA